MKQDGKVKWKLHTGIFLCIRRQGGSSRDLGTPVIRHEINLIRVLSGLVWKTVTYLPQGTKGIPVEMAEFRDYGWHWELLWKSGISAGEEESPDKVSKKATLATGVTFWDAVDKLVGILLLTNGNTFCVEELLSLRLNLLIHLFTVLGGCLSLSAQCCKTRGCCLLEGSPPS